VDSALPGSNRNDALANETKPLVDPSGLPPEWMAAFLAYQSWLEDSAPRPAGPQPFAPIPPIDLLKQFLALRQDLQLLTRATRSLAESRPSGTTPGTPATPHPEALLQPWIKFTLDLADSLTLALRTAQAVAKPTGADPWASSKGTELPLRPEPSEPPPRRRFLAFWKTARKPSTGSPAPAESLRAPDAVTAIAEGVAMTLRRLERFLSDQGFEAIPTVGLPFQPDRMEVVAVVDRPGTPPEQVVAEVRRGYTRAGQLIRYAQVEVQK